MNKLHLYKFTISESQIADEVWIGMPQFAKVIHVAEQRGMICLWALVNREEPAEPRKFLIRGTGQEVEADLRYVGTAHVNPFVWHIFEKEV